jgi:hypothetical protein
MRFHLQGICEDRGDVISLRRNSEHNTETLCLGKTCDLAGDDTRDVYKFWWVIF